MKSQPQKQIRTATERPPRNGQYENYWGGEVGGGGGGRGGGEVCVCGGGGVVGGVGGMGVI